MDYRLIRVTKEHRKKLIVIVGPTAVGKTRTAIELAKHFHTEIISADSRQFFKEISIGTAKPDMDELAEAKHHFINSHSIFDEINAGRFEVEALAVIAKLHQQYNQLIMVGGSGLYINAVCDGLDDLPKADETLRQQIVDQYEKEGIVYLQSEVERLDPQYFRQVDQSNPQRLMRALEVCLMTGQPFSSFRNNSSKERPFEVIKIGLNLPREELYARINHRVDLMVEVGLVEEARAMYPNKETYALQTVGYTELFDYFEGMHSLERAIELIKQNTRRFAKRQITWFNRDKNTTWFKPDEVEKIITFLG
ncbi:tRNA (adenosine(37)-N6)-dimethylallyltransferase MiaA [Solitalea canadensis]|uniref:tRNA dimethylallyltransferase n=1 Tax=Solitalea canadensis (strain ATCC 29591 / DSM 3403 / JCM 21819 / LMG 8368 / NBRC 15130 / NCIMB 12057 / USAM 9D) TaxID=929556 RepID=H8KXW1_SOLCM|nr:tRNA (adenosine(37)-N6)-dimethylallyltransferase MiaA [Solitalea canadensis]AFD05637.1 tRNA isopentenyltransferase MiaA [Solitalea canadensis DSM 3403]